MKAGQDYLVVDDTLTMGGTVASLRGYVESHGGKVVAASVMTAHEGAVDLVVRCDQPRVLDLSARTARKVDTLYPRPIT